MAGRAHKTEHAGAKRGRGAYWGRKAEAKRESNKVRRENAKRAVRQGLADSDSDLYILPPAALILGEKMVGERCVRSVTASCRQLASDAEGLAALALS